MFADEEVSVLQLVGGGAVKAGVEGGQRFGSLLGQTLHVSGDTLQVPCPPRDA